MLWLWLHFLFHLDPVWKKKTVLDVLDPDRAVTRTRPKLGATGAGQSPGQTGSLSDRIMASHGSSGNLRVLRALLTRTWSRTCSPRAPVPQRSLSASSGPPPTGTEGLSHSELYRLSITDPDRFWGSAAQRLQWVEPFHRVRDCDLSSGKIGWFLGGKINVSGKSWPGLKTVQQVYWGAKSTPTVYLNTS